MKRVWVTLATACTLIVVGCGVPSYNKRIETTVEQLSFLQAMNTFLLPEAAGKFKELNVVLRLPKPAAEIGTAFAPPAGLFDHIASYQATPESAPAKEGAAPIAALPPLKIHVFVRQKPKKAKQKKGEAAPAETVTATRGSFVSDVTQTIATEIGADAANGKAPQSKRIGNTAFKELIFASVQTGNDVRAYFAEANKGELEAAIIFDIPKVLRTQAIVTKGVDYCLRSFALGGGAKKAADGAAGNAKGADGPAF